jgi:glycine/D-amino acid oxidase-like deaminating enzyme/nitrite reductase/ring-hydroxylating ferredoxin subunit
VRSLWLTGSAPARPPLDDDLEADVLVIGGGIVGITCAYLLASRGADVVLCEADELASGTTGNTTAKITAAHGLIYSALEDRHDAQVAAAYARLNRAGLELIGRLHREQAIECDWRARDAVTYTLDPSRSGGLEEEIQASRRAGLEAELRQEPGLPFAVAGAIAVAGQAEFHPVKWTRGLAAAAERAGARIFEGSRALGLDNESGGAVIEFERGTVTAQKVVLATHYPTFDRGMFFARLSAQRSYCIAARVRGPLPSGMFISADQPTRSIRTYQLGDGEELLIVGGEGHKAGQDDDTRARYEALEDWTREHFDVVSIDYRWSAQDPVSPDLLPYIGPLTRTSDTVVLATGFSKWGIAAGAGAAAMLVDRVTGDEHPDAKTFDAKRIHPRSAGPSVVKENLNVAGHLIGDRLHGGRDASALGCGEGAIAGHGLRPVAAFRDDDGELYEFSATCTHLGCELRFNTAEASWDCPCHGSRFDARTGAVLEGPAVHALRPREQGKTP